MSGLAELARRRKELEELFAFVEDIEYPGGLAAASIEAGLGDPTEWIRPLRDTIAAIGQRPLFVRFIAAQVLHVDRWHRRNPLLTLAVSWQSQCSPAKIKAWVKATGRRPPRLGGKMEYMESMVVHIGRSWPQLDENLGTSRADWLVTVASPSVAQPLGQGQCLSVGGLGTSDRPLLQAVAEQRLAWASANLAYGAAPGAGQPRKSACGLSADLIEEVGRWLPPRAELSKRGAERAVSLGIIVASLATRESGTRCAIVGPEPEPEPEPLYCVSAQTEPALAVSQPELHPWSRAAANLQERFAVASAQEVWAALEAEAGHAGRAAAILRGARHEAMGGWAADDET